VQGQLHFIELWIFRVIKSVHIFYDVDSCHGLEANVLPYSLRYPDICLGKSKTKINTMKDYAATYELGHNNCGQSFQNCLTAPVLEITSTNLSPVESD
jgi:hypothetical protein